MIRLISKGLMFGNLFPVTSPALVERYNRALKHLTGKTTKLKEFHIDISGYSPEIGDAFKDHLYLNQNGCNRQFILLSCEQKRAPLLNSKFSTSRGILRQFIESNEAQLFALTARDAVAGELMNSVLSVETPDKLFDIRKITIEADTTGGHVAEARELEALIAQFRASDDGWWDDVLIARMIGLAKSTGDVMRNPVTLRSADFSQDNFWTSHFGGLYLFRDVEAPAVIALGDKARLGQLPIEHLFDFRDRNQIAKFFELNKMVEPIVKARNVDAAAILRQKMDFIVVEVAASTGEDLTDARRRDLRQVAKRHTRDLPEAYHGLADLLRWVEGGGNWPRITSEHPAYFYTLRARPTRDRDLVNMLLAELCPLDIRQLFICHKEAFYAAYAGWEDTKKTFVADFLAREYAVDKAGARAALFGPEPGMEEPEEPEEDLIAQVGPWGAVRRRR